MKPKDEVEAELPGADLVSKGLADLERDQLTDCALLVLVAAPRLRGLGLRVPFRKFDVPCEHLLYSRLEETLGSGAHSHYNSLLRRITSFIHAREREQSRKPAK